ncbi:MAG: hypothetical protein R2800_07290 [Flavipsychrobacter sp.]
MRNTLSLITYSILTLLLLSTSACTRKSSDTIAPNNETNPIPFDAIHNCHKASNPYPSQITNNILGNWQWEKTFNPWTQKTTFASKHVLIHFNDASTYHITESGVTVATGVWSLKQLSSTEWQLQLTQDYEHTQGTIALCNNELILSSTYVDGPANYFVRKSQ